MRGGARWGAWGSKRWTQRKRGRESRRAASQAVTASVVSPPTRSKRPSTGLPSHRLRVGIGGPNRGDAVDHVLGRFDDDEMKVIDDALAQAAKAVACWCDRGIDEAMTRFNRRPKPPKEKPPREASGGENDV